MEQLFSLWVSREDCLDQRARFTDKDVSITGNLCASVCPLKLWLAMDSRSVVIINAARRKRSASFSPEIKYPKRDRDTL